MDIFENAIIEYKKWVENTKDDPYMQKELSILENSGEELLECFNSELVFGTSGIRGIIGPGPSRINKYVVARATQGLANYINKLAEKNPSVNKKAVIACDSRRFSTQFARETADVLSGNGIKAYLFSEVTPVPVLSYSIEALGCDYGIMITASHNSGIFNGYKVFNKYGYQIVGDEPKEILDEISKLDYFDGINKSQDLIELLNDDISEAFSAKVNEITKIYADDVEDKSLSIVYTPLNGAGNQYIKRALKDAGFENVYSVPSQDVYDSDFSTCKTPNPEKLSAYSEAFRVLDQMNADIIIASDPDSDRAGCAIIHDGTKVNLTGNQIALLMLDFMCSVLPPKDGEICYRSIVSTPLIDRMAEVNGLTVESTLIGFKYIGEKIEELIKEGKPENYYFGFEESNGFLMNHFIRDKDAISSAVMIALMAAKHKSKGQDLIDRLEEIYDDYGTLIDRSRSYNFEGLAGKETMEAIMDHLRNSVTDQIGDLYIEDKTDYLLDDTGLPKANIIRFDMDDGSTAIVRPSGTEPKIKIYMFLTDPTSNIDKAMNSIMESFK